MKILKSMVMESKKKGQTDYAAFCKDVAFYVRASPQMKRTISDWLAVPMSSLNRDIRVGEVMHIYPGLADRIYANNAQHKVRLLQTISKKSYTFAQRLAELQKGATPKKGAQLALPFEKASTKTITKTKSSTPGVFRSSAPQPDFGQAIYELLVQLNEKIDKLGTGILPNGAEKAVVMAIKNPEDRGFSASSICQEFKNANPHIVMNVDRVREAAGRLQMIDDKNFGFYAEHATSVTGFVGGGHWRFNARAKKVLQNVLGDFSTLLDSKANAEKRERDVWNHLLVTLTPIGKGKAQALVRHEALQPTN